MTRLLIQDNIMDKLDVYVDYTVDGDEVILFDYGLELTGKTIVNGLQGREVLITTNDMSLRGYEDTLWMPDALIDYITMEEEL